MAGTAPEAGPRPAVLADGRAWAGFAGHQDGLQQSRPPPDQMISNNGPTASNAASPLGAVFPTPGRHHRSSDARATVSPQGNGSHCRATGNWDNASPVDTVTWTRPRRPGPCTAPGFYRRHQGSRPAPERRPRSPTPPQVRRVGAPSTTAGLQTHEQRIQSVQAQLTIRHPKTNVSAGQKPAQVGRVGLEPTADGL